MKLRACHTHSSFLREMTRGNILYTGCNKSMHPGHLDHYSLNQILYPEKNTTPFRPNKRDQQPSGINVDNKVTLDG